MWTGFIVVLWMSLNPAAPGDGQAVIYKEKFASKWECQVAVAEKMNVAKRDYGGTLSVAVKLEAGCAEEGEST